MSDASPEISPLMRDMSGYIATGWKRNLPRDVAEKDQVRLTPDPALPRRHPIIEIKALDGGTLSHRTPAVRGTPDNPMDRQEVEDKAFDLLTGPLGEGKAGDLIDRIWNIEQVANMCDLRPMLMP